jgi:hypothetical protein
MKILLLHPDDDAVSGPWTNLAWDKVVDIGLGGVETYRRWTEHFRCPVGTLGSLRNRLDDLRRVRDVLSLGCGRLIDEHGLDWWEMTALLVHGEFERFILLQRFAQSISLKDQIYVSRPGVHASLLSALLGKQVTVFPFRRGAGSGGLGHYTKVFKRLSSSQMVDVFWDKYDAGYQLRGRLARKPRPSMHPVVLLPTAYVNVSRTGLAYADSFPEENFLLVATRRSGWVQEPPRNVDTAWLSAYASVRERSRENSEMKSKWLDLLKEFVGVAELQILNSLGRFDFFLDWIRCGFQVRDAWLNVLDREPIEGVLCPDDSNPYTRIPVLLAQSRGVPTIACHHGALDGRYLFKRFYADVVWARGRMEQDYLVGTCGVPSERVEIGAPIFPKNWDQLTKSRTQDFQPYILFLSEAVDQAGGRTQEFYRDILPPLADLAFSTGRKLIVKLHPAEGERERAAMIARILSAEQKSVTSIVSGPLTEELLTKAWFGITILSTVAMECAVRGIPCFLCTWLECWPYGYVEQFMRFEVGIGLTGPDEIRKIPEYLQQKSVSANVRKDCWSPAAPGRLRQILTSSDRGFTTVEATAAGKV